jgi:hypothetical protein
MANSVPTLTGLNSPTFLENTVNTTPQLIDASVALADRDGNLAGGTLTVTGLLPEDVVSIRNAGTGAGQIGFFAGVVTYQGATIGQVFGGAGGTFSVLLNANASVAAVEALIESLNYANMSDVPTTSRTLSVDLRDGTGAAAIAPLAFTQRSGAANPLDGVAVEDSAPSFVDLDGDGDLDTVVGEYDGDLRYFENTGTAAAPAFAAAVVNPFGWSNVDSHSKPAFADLDGDGDVDAVVGEFGGELHYFRNTGTATAPAFAAAVSNPFGLADVGFNSAPSFADLDGDGDLDAMVGEGDNGALHFFENTGTATAPAFAAAVVNPFGLAAVGGAGAPSFADLDGDGDLDAIVGNGAGVLNYFENTGTATAPAFVPAVLNPFGLTDVGSVSAPSFIDLDGDGDLDAVVGNGAGVLNYFENTTRPSVFEITVSITAEGDWPTKTFDFALVDAEISYAGNTVIIDGPSSHTVVTGMKTYIFTDGTVKEDDGNPLVADLFYYSQNHDVWNAHIDADQHFHQSGWQQGLDPSAFFDTSLYLSANPGVKAAGVDPLVFFDQTGWKARHTPSLAFDPAQYLAANPDVAAAGVDPLWHFLAVGASEGRMPFAPTELLGPGGFDFAYYLANNPDVAASGLDPLFHFQVVGWREGRDPNAYFDMSGYLSTYTDVAAAGINPFDHYNQVGWTEGRDPSVGFDTTAYLAAYPDVAAANVNPLVHFLYAGQHEGRSPQGDGLWG